MPKRRDEDGRIISEQIDEFWANGVLVVERAVSDQELANLKQVFEGLKKRADYIAKIMVKH